MKNIKTYVFSLGMVFLLAACNGNNPVGPTSIESQESSQSANQGITLIAPEDTSMVSEKVKAYVVLKPGYEKIPLNMFRMLLCYSDKHNRPRPHRHEP